MLVIYKQGDLSCWLSSSLLFCIFPIISTVSPRQIKVKILHLFTSSLKHDISSEFSNVFQYPNLFLLEEWPLLLCLSQRDGPEVLSIQDTKQVRFIPVPILSLLFPMPEKKCSHPFRAHLRPSETMPETNSFVYDTFFRLSHSP